MQGRSSSARRKTLKSFAKRTSKKRQEHAGRKQKERFAQMKILHFFFSRRVGMIMNEDERSPHATDDLHDNKMCRCHCKSAHLLSNFLMERQ